jgi:hypothetical protein
MSQEILINLIKDYQLGLREDISFLESFFPCSWCFVDEDGYELTVLYGDGIYAIFYHHRTLKHFAIEFLSGTNPLKVLFKFVHRLEEKYGISFEEYTSRILAEFVLVGGKWN